MIKKLNEINPKSLQLKDELKKRSVVLPWIRADSWLSRLTKFIGPPHRKKTGQNVRI